MGVVGELTLTDESGLPIGPSEELTLKDIQNIEEAIQEMVSQLKFLSSVRGISADLRVTTIGGLITTVSTVTNVTTVGTVTTVTTVATVTNIAQIGGIPANQLIPSQQNLIAQMGNVVNTIGY